MTVPRIDPDRAVIILIDVQPWFLDRMHGDSAGLVNRLEQLLLVAEWFKLPVLATLEEPTDRKGKLPEELEQIFPKSGLRLPKTHYNLCEEPPICDAITTLKRDQYIVAGGETDVCVLLSVLGLLREDRQVFLLEDCLFSSAANIEPASHRMRNAGAIPLTYKTLFYELCRDDDPRTWEQERAHAEERGWISPEDLP